MRKLDKMKRIIDDIDMAYYSLYDNSMLNIMLIMGSITLTTEEFSYYHDFGRIEMSYKSKLYADYQSLNKVDQVMFRIYLHYKFGVDFKSYITDNSFNTI